MVALSLKIVGFGVLLALSGFFSGAESALFSLTRLTQQRFEKSKSSTEQAIARALSQPKRLIIDIVIWNNIVNIGVTALATSLAYQLLGDIGVAISVAVMTVALLLVGEITPKTFAVRNAELVSKVVIHPIRLFSLFTAPVRWIFVLLSEWSVRLASTRYRLEGKDLTEEELKTIIDVSEKEGVLDPLEKEMITGVLEFTDTCVGEIMTPRVDMIAINSQWTQRKALSFLKKHYVAKVPVYNGSTDKILGFVYAKDILLNPKKSFRRFVRPIILVPETKKIHILLNEFKAKNVKIAIVLDEYGGTEGIITLEDILEEIFGEIHDEFEEEVKEIVKLGHNKYRVLGRAHIDDINDRLGSMFSHEEYNTLNGYIIGHLGRLPRKKETMKHRGWVFTVDEVSKRRVVSVTAEKPKRRRKK